MLLIKDLARGELPETGYFVWDDTSGWRRY
jgi:hypothetical protein